LTLTTLHGAIDTKDSNNNNDLEGYKINPVVPVPDSLPLASSMAPTAATPPIHTNTL
jgi:hypothetical protein